MNADDIFKHIDRKWSNRVPLDVSDVDWLVWRVRELETVSKRVRHCEHCGGSWFEDGFQSECYCKRIADIVREHVPTIEMPQEEES